MSEQIWTQSAPEVASTGERQEFMWHDISFLAASHSVYIVIHSLLRCIMGLNECT